MKRHARKTTVMLMVLVASLFAPSDAAAVGPDCGYCEWIPGLQIFACLTYPNVLTWCWLDVQDPYFCIDGNGGCGNTQP
jgi:hypothetical protein